MKRHLMLYSLFGLWIALFLTNCAKDPAPKLIGPLSWIQMGMTRAEIISHIPLKGSRNTLTPSFIHVRNIQEQTYTQGGLTAMIFIFRKEDGKRLLNAAHLTFDGNKTGEQSLVSQISKRFGKPSGRVWKVKGGFTIDIQKGPNKTLKVTFDTPG